ncbi:glycosyltransferase [Lysinibacillus sp. NPDC093190]|uniref:glycosyltransferase family 2 protein n=1 Tax=Lysinibacillus sp. NPDC093190 TaxID=3390575 RepID=UPI003D03DB39
MEDICISAVIPVFNAEQYIEKAIQSILNQAVHVQEIIVVDDGSTDRTCEIVENLQLTQPTVFFYKQENAGASSARNNGISTANSKWILLLDADDECTEDLIEHYKNKIQNDDYAAVYADFTQIDEGSNAISGSFLGQELRGNKGFCQMLIRNPIISPSGSIIKKAAFEKVGGFDTNIKYGEDVDFWLRLLNLNFNVGHVPKPLIRIRRHATNTTANIAITKTGEKILLDKYSTTYIKEKIYSRDCSVEESHLDFANLLIRYDKWQEAYLLLQSIQIDKSNNRYISFLFIRTIVAIYFKNFQYAMRIYEEILRNVSQHGAALNNLGVLYALNEDKVKAEQCIRKALTLYPGYIDATHNLSQLGFSEPSYKFTMRELRNNLLRYS